MSLLIEAKAIQKIRELLIADADIKGYVQARVYPQHVSLIKGPVYPAISLSLLPGQARTDVPDMSNMLVQIDLWFPEDGYTIDDMLSCYARVRAILHRQQVYDTAIGITFGQIYESGIGPVMYDANIRGHHLPARYAMAVV